VTTRRDFCQKASAARARPSSPTFSVTRPLQNSLKWRRANTASEKPATMTRIASSRSGGLSGAKRCPSAHGKSSPENQSIRRGRNELGSEARRPGLLLLDRTHSNALRTQYAAHTDQSKTTAFHENREVIPGSFFVLRADPTAWAISKVPPELGAIGAAYRTEKRVPKSLCLQKLVGLPNPAPLQ